MEYPVEGKHTDDESGDKASDSGNRTPVFHHQEPLPEFMTAPGIAFQTSGGPTSFYTRIPKNRRKSSKHAKRSNSPSLVDADSKPSSNKEKKRLERKKSSKHSKKHSKKA